MGKLDGKVAVITGGSSGIGKATVQLFVREGARVVFGDILDERGKQLADELGENVIYLHTNVRNESEIKDLIDLAINKFNRLDIMFNNAGFGGAVGPIDEIPIDAFDVTMEVLFRSVFLGIKYAAQIMKEQKSGSIISTSSIAGLRAEGLHIYSSAKAAIIQLTRSVSMELGEYNVRVNCICPGIIATPIFGKGVGLDQIKAERMVNLLKIRFPDMQPIKRTGLPEDIANAALWLASEGSSFVTGHALVVDGGYIGGSKWTESLDAWKEVANTLGLEDFEEIVRRINDDIAKSK